MPRHQIVRKYNYSNLKRPTSRNSRKMTKNDRRLRVWLAIGGLVLFEGDSGEDGLLIFGRHKRKPTTRLHTCMRIKSLSEVFSIFLTGKRMSGCCISNL
jgi:hypothetical protein